MVRIDRLSRQNNVALIADDDMFTRSMLRAILQDFCDIVETGSGAEVMALYEHHFPDIVFLDLHMPDKSGRELLENIRVYDPNAYVVVVSGDSMREMVMDMARTGARGYVCKPFGRKRILNEFNRCPTVRFSDLAKVQPHG